MLRIAIDGACRRNGKPDCVSSGGVFIQHYKDGTLVGTDTRSNYEYNSTNQRGELLALLTALDYIHASKQDAQVITDSEYIFNAMTKLWYLKWQMNGWLTASGDPVKNADIWREITMAKSRCESVGMDIVFYHIKGHVIPFGKVAAENLLRVDPTGMLLHGKVCEKYDSLKSTKEGTLAAVQELSVKNNGFELSGEILRSFVAANVVVDAVATQVVELADREI